MAYSHDVRGPPLSLRFFTLLHHELCRRLTDLSRKRAHFVVCSDDSMSCNICLSGILGRLAHVAHIQKQYILAPGRSSVLVLFLLSSKNTNPMHIGEYVIPDFRPSGTQQRQRGAQRHFAIRDTRSDGNTSLLRVVK
ncbi:uncharacterized protein FOMMEDRAFT_143531 [Fomitiporia mediterranea MF3/22]|uniref:uncharacterized protein n=1 Tax=Fomitiporia mediterranea (strain MF3/22) TaxID=694068 RepID=UPI0004408DE7|nr:uncharacterized protein FOMMEDRAFT_143531 [Fomitiporia mediterranea MF3/22]EJC98065.1 hypothetical protein FOMMEDRAFT_143531 [Fomitiporia mediterranea MF3/22]